jgi:hypothetical protein
MAVSRTLEPDPGHAGVGTETRNSLRDRLRALSLLRFAWISALKGLEIIMHIVLVAASGSLLVLTLPSISVG